MILYNDYCDIEDAKNLYTIVIHELGKNSPIILVRAKCDLTTVNDNSKDEADQFAKSKGIKHIQVSSKNEINVEYVFTTLVE